MNDNLKFIEAFETVSDEKASECAHYLVKLLFEIVTSSLAKHSKRASSEQVCTTVPTCKIHLSIKSCLSSLKKHVNVNKQAHSKLN